MKTAGGIPWRHTVRLQNFDYSSAATWFVTICTHEKRHLFGEVVNAEVELSHLGRIAREELRRSAELRSEITIDESIVMPNHVHLIVFIPDADLHDGRHVDLHRRPRSLGSFIAGYKSAVTSRSRMLLGDASLKIWQYKYYEQGIRSDKDLDSIRQYIRDNPWNWEHDPENNRR